MSNAHFRQPKKDWSRRKHAVLENYLPTFCRALSRAHPPPIWYVDGFAGAGIFRDPTDPADPGEEGSPVLAARVTQKLPYDIRCLNVEEDLENYQSLVRETAPFPHVTNILADLNDVIDEVLAMVTKHPAFFFLDPFGTKDLPMEGLIDRIALRREPTDILVRYATETVRRLAAGYEKDIIHGQAYARNLDRWFRGNGWRDLVQQYPVGPDRDSELLQYYLNQLVSISGGRLSLSTAYPIRTIEGQVKYQLVFATGNRLGLKLMNDVLFRAEANYQEESATHQQQKQEERLHGQTSMFDEPVADSSELYNQLVAEVATSILTLASPPRGIWEFEELFYTLIVDNQWFARITQRELRLACLLLHKQGKIERVSQGKSWSRRTRFRIRTTA